MTHELRRQDAWVLGAMACLMAVTAAWWSLALWPLPTDAPPWLARARSVCFNTVDTGLPDRSGWLLLTGQPLGMAGLLWVGWGHAVRESLARLVATRAGRLVAIVACMACVAGLAATGVRVATAGPTDTFLVGSGDVPDTYPRLDRTVPDMSALVDQFGRPFELEHLDGRGAFVTFAFGHCETVCPMVVHASRDARQRLWQERPMSVIVVTLDPWRDTPSRLGHLVRQFGLDPKRGDAVLSGNVDAVEAALDAWSIARRRDTSTGDVVHPALVYVLEPDGTVAYASAGSPEQLEKLGRRLR